MSEPIKINGPKQLSFSERGHKKQHQSSGEFHELISYHAKILPNVTVIELFKVPSSYARFMPSDESRANKYSFSSIAMIVLSVSPPTIQP